MSKWSCLRQRVCYVHCCLYIYLKSLSFTWLVTWERFLNSLCWESLGSKTDSVLLRWLMSNFIGIIVLQKTLIIAKGRRKGFDHVASPPHPVCSCKFASEQKPTKAELLVPLNGQPHAPKKTRKQGRKAVLFSHCHSPTIDYLSELRCCLWMERCQLAIMASSCHWYVPSPQMGLTQLGLFKYCLSPPPPP